MESELHKISNKNKIIFLLVTAYWSQQMSSRLSFTFPSFRLLPLTLLLLLLSTQFQTWEISGSQLQGVAGWNQFHWMGDRKHVPTQHFRSMPMKWPRGTSANLWCSLEDSIAFRLDLIQASLSRSKLIPAWKVTCKHHYLISTLQYAHIFNVKSRWCEHVLS